MQPDEAWGDPPGLAGGPAVAGIVGTYVRTKEISQPQPRGVNSDFSEAVSPPKKKSQSLTPSQISLQILILVSGGAVRNASN